MGENIGKRGRAAVITLGCKVNQYESQAIASALIELGFDAICGITPADLFVINTCSVTAEADKKSRQAIARALKLNPSAKIIVLGCSSQNDSSWYVDKPNVAAVFGTSGKIENVRSAVSKLTSLDSQAATDNQTTTDSQIVTDNQTETESQAATDKAENTVHSQEKSGQTEIEKRGQFLSKSKTFKTAASYEDDMTPIVNKTRAYLKIQDGCDSYCAYCRVPYLRGKSRSRPIQSVLSEAQFLSTQVKEIVLAGVDISAYGKDIGTDLLHLIDSLSVNVRLRLSSLECNVIDERLLTALSQKGVCDHFHLSLQSGSDTVLKRMNRKYTTAQFLDKVRLIRQYFPFASITTDIIAGFPLETESEHQDTKNFLTEVKLSDMHVFPFSPRRGTKAFDMPQLDKHIRESRAAELTNIGKRLKEDFLRQNIGRVLTVYAESAENGFVTGFTTNYIKVYTKLKTGELKDVRLTALYKDGVLGESI